MYRLKDYRFQGSDVVGRERKANHNFTSNISIFVAYKNQVIRIVSLDFYDTQARCLGVIRVSDERNRVDIFDYYKTNQYHSDIVNYFFRVFGLGGFTGTEHRDISYLLDTFARRQGYLYPQIYTSGRG